MQIINTLVIAAGLLTVSQAYIVTMWENPDCTGHSEERNVWDNTCAYVRGFQSFALTTYGGSGQLLTAWSRQACAGPTTFERCAAGVNRIPDRTCFRATNSAGGSNALSSYWYGGDCPN